MPTPMRLGSEFQINDINTGTQARPAVALLNDGRFVAVYDSNQIGSFEVFARFFSADGTPEGPAFQVNIDATGSQVFAEVTTLSNGNFVVAYRSSAVDADGDITARIFEPDGTPVTGEFQINATALNRQDDVFITALQNGGFVATYSSSEAGTIQPNDILARGFNADGTEAFAEIPVNTTTLGDQDEPDIATLADGSFVIVYEAANVDGNLAGIVARRFAEDGTPLTGEIVVNTQTVGAQLDPSIVALANGGYAVTFTDTNGTDGNGSGVFVRVFNSNNVGGTVQQVNTFTTGSQFESEIALTEDGGFIVTYISVGQVNVQDVFGQRFDATGAPVGDEFMVNSLPTTTSGLEFISLGGRNFVASFNLNGSDGDGFGVFGQIVTLNQAASLDLTRGPFQEATPNALVATFDDTDADGDPITFSLANPADATTFQIVGNELRLADGVTLNFEEGVETFIVFVRAEDQFGAGTEEAVIVRVSDIVEGDQVLATLGDGANLFAGEGNDSLEGDGRANILDGDEGNDTLRGNDGNDELRGDQGDDFISAGLGDDTANGGSGDDQIFAGAGDAGDDTFQGDTGSDVIGGGAGNDTLVGGTNDESDEDSADILFGGSGEDLLVTGNFEDANGDGIATASEVSGNGNDTAFSGAGNDTVYGAGGDDTLGGGADSDIINAGDGNDVIFGGVPTEGAASDDTLDGGAGNDEIFAGDGDDSVLGGDGNDLLFNGTGDDVVDGGAGDDTLFAGPGQDTLTGGANADTFAFATGSGVDVVTDFDTEEDILDFSELGNEVDLSTAADVNNIDTGDGLSSGLMIDLGDGNSVLLVGLSTSDIASLNILM